MSPRDPRLRASLAAHLDALGYGLAARIVREDLEAHATIPRALFENQAGEPDLYALAVDPTVRVLLIEDPPA